MKPDWKNAPLWADWLAMDGDGIWVWFQDKPEWEAAFHEWQLSADADDDSAYEEASTPDCDGIDWDFAYDTLEERP
jgi:hypothetical protein